MEAVELGGGRRRQVAKSGVVAGAPTEQSVVPVDAIRAELGPGSDEGGLPSSQGGVLERNAIAIDPLTNVDLRTLIGIANPANGRRSDFPPSFTLYQSRMGDYGLVDGIWRNTYVGPVTGRLQGYARLLSSLDPATRHSAAVTRAVARTCQPGARRDIVCLPPSLLPPPLPEGGDWWGPDPGPGCVGRRGWEPAGPRRPLPPQIHRPAPHRRPRLRAPVHQVRVPNDDKRPR